MSRLSERYEASVEEGAKRELERRYMMAEMFGEGGVRLSRIEKMELFKQMALDPTGAGMIDTLARRRAANKLGPTDVPKDWWTWVTTMTERMQGYPVEEQR